MHRQRAGAQLRPDAALAQLRMREIEVIAPLGHVIRILVADRKAEPHREPIGADDIQPDDFWLLAEIECEGRRDNRLPAGDYDASVTFVDPLRLRTGTAVGRATALHAPIEHAH